MPEDALKVIDSYKRARDRDKGRSIEDALREERNEARGKLREIGLTLGCVVDEIIPTLALMEKQIEDARAIIRKARTDEVGRDDEGGMAEEAP